MQENSNRRRIKFGNDARKPIIEGAAKLARAVSSTMGAAGRAVLIDNEFDVDATLDGVTVANDVLLEDAYENMGAKLIKQAAQQTNAQAGDGTTTAIVLAYRIMADGLAELEEGRNAIQMRRGMQRACDAAVAELRKMALPGVGREQLKQVAAVASRDERIGEMVADMFERIGKDGLVTLEKDPVVQGTRVDYVEGMQFDRGMVSYHFSDPGTPGEVLLEDCLVLLYEGQVSALPSISPLLELVSKDQAAGNSKGLLIVCDELTRPALPMLIHNHRLGHLRCVAVASPEYGPQREGMLNDLAILTGGCFFSPKTGDALSDITLPKLGRAKRVHVTLNATTIIGADGSKELIERRADELRALAKKSTDDYNRERFNARAARITSGIAVMKIGAVTDVEQRELYQRVEDAIGSAKSALAEGLVPGGGTALLKAMVNLEAMEFDDKDQSRGAKIVLNALLAPAEQLAANAGLDGRVILEKVAKSKNPWEGLDVLTGEIRDLKEAGILDAAMVQRLALQHAVSVAGIFLCLDSAIAPAGEGERKHK